MFSVFRGPKYDDIRPNDTKKKQQPKINSQKPCVFMDLTRNFLVPDFHRPNGAKILRFGNFPHTLVYPRGVENCQKSKSFREGLKKREKYGMSR